MHKEVRKRKSIALIVSLILFTTLVFSQGIFAKQYVYKWTNIKEIQVTAYRLNVRSGPGTKYPVVGILPQNKVVTVAGTLGGYFVVHLDNDVIGVVSSTYTRVYSYHNSSGDPAPTPTPTPTPTPDDSTANLSAQEKELIDLINSERSKNGLAALKPDMEVMKVARLKAQDLAKNKYFSHDSPTYGSPFDMLKSFGVTYKAAGENIAGNSSVAAAHKALMNSPGHRANILKANFNSIGVGIASDSRYGLVFCEMFIQK